MIWQLCKIIHTNTWVSYSRGHYISLLSYDSRNNFIALHDRDLVKYTRDHALRCDHVLPELLLATYIIDFRVQGLETNGITRNHPRFGCSVYFP